MCMYITAHDAENGSKSPIMINLYDLDEGQRKQGGRTVLTLKRALEESRGLQHGYTCTPELATPSPKL